MSAYMVEREHIRYLIEAATSRLIEVGSGDTIRFYRRSGTAAYRHEYRSVGNACEGEKDYSDLGQVLWNENRRSIEARYPDTRGKPENMPGMIEEAEGEFRYGRHNYDPPFPTFDPLQVIHSADCYAYQACEHDEWEASEAKAFIDALRDAALSALKRGKDLIWGAPKAMTGVVSISSMMGGVR